MPKESGLAGILLAPRKEIAQCPTDTRLNINAGLPLRYTQQPAAPDCRHCKALMGSKC